MRSHIFNDSRESLLPRRNATELTCIKIHVEEAIQSFGENCPHLEEVIVRHCEWVTARIIWLFAKHCSNLVKLDARGAARCAVKRLTSRVLEASPPVMDSIGTIDATEPEVALRHPFNNFILVEAVEILEEQQGIDWPDLRYESRPGNDSFNSNTFGYIVVHNKNALDIIRSRHISPESIQTLTPATVFRANKETGGFDVLQMSFKYSDLLKYRIAPVSQVPKVYRNQFHNHTSLKHIIFEILKTAKQACVTDLSWFKDESED
ncbi:hypothetical protein BDF20DRAFT_851540 [Mycotypha africana]|uniref:uncharacterized protein n=1 Tax=Mycotypha africana TaxID=64632 RepID=UPI0022FFD8D5|nr:uncharacterized protein BDF20DRAFT_851540 [Mycotypha africana]KAI8987665.1 hypothetical protein BDF20DRAFT_851540 [Mycotypha africana]